MQLIKLTHFGMEMALFANRGFFAAPPCSANCHPIIKDLKVYSKEKVLTFKLMLLKM